MLYVNVYMCTLYYMHDIQIYCYKSIDWSVVYIFLQGEFFSEPGAIDYESRQDYTLRITATDQAAIAASRLTATTMASDISS